VEPNTADFGAFHLTYKFKPGFLNNTFAIEEKCFWLAADVEADVADG
jgi:hypothetical protein